MSGSEKRIKVSNIANYYENPRHPIASDEFDTLKKLFDSVGIPQMLNLASDIKAHGLLPCNRIVVVYSEFLKKYVVYEGNRRVAAIKLLLYPDTFTFLDKATIDKVKKIVSGPGVDLSTSLNCYVTDETEAFFIMERLHSGEDHGRGLKSWDAREKENFKVRQGNKQSLSNLIYLYVQKYCDGLDITTILPFTTIQRIFNNRKVRTKIGLDVSNEATFTPDRINLVVEASKWIVAESDNSQMSITRLFNTSDTISDKLCPWIDTYHSTHPAPTYDYNSLDDSLTENSDDSLKEPPLQMNLTRTLPHLLLLSPRFQKIKTTLPPLQIRQIHQNLLVPHPQFIHQVPLVPAALKISLISFRDWITANLTLTILLLTAYQQSVESYSSFQTRSSFQLILLPLHS